MKTWLWKGVLGAAVALAALMRNVLKAGMLASITAAATFWIAPPAAAQGVSQIVLSCSAPNPVASDPNGCRNSELAGPPDGTPPIIVGTTLFIFGGFWVWCQSPNGGTPYGPDCNGAVYVEEVDLVSKAANYEPTSISGNSSSGGPTGLQVEFKSSDGDLSCTLGVPTSPTTGMTNTLSGFCDGVPISFRHVVVQVTGP